MKSTLIKVSDVGEKQLIERIIEKSKSCSIFNTSVNDYDNNFNVNSFKISIGDDSALTEINLDENSYLVTSSDMLIQSSHFPQDMTYFQMGYKVVVVNVSDLASMGAENIGFLLNIAIPKDMLLDDFDDLICGVIRACDNYDIPLIGGDTNQANEIILSGTAVGQVDKDKVLMKYGFKPGDLVCISGELGLAALGFELLKLKNQLNNNLFEMVDIEEKIKTAYEIDSSLCDLAIFKALKVEARYKEGHILRDYNTENNRISTTDITDGLASEFYEILNSDKKYCKFNNKNNNQNLGIDDFNNDSDNRGLGSDNFIDNSNSFYSKGIRIYEDKLPVEDEFKQIANVLDLNYLDLLLHIGEDFELLFTINTELKEKLLNDLSFYIIGEITDKNTVEIVLSNGDIEKISSRGYQHLK
ncbi:thiamine-phosphate kinase [Methanobrevibacter olleyae]|uniref:Thiamine-monophosphate kinase n=1 Tax=Methanobrevibacter olleyae TaxID=294671 RepID=A0A126R2B6_METOL|nr:thiamine-phosphate kinase [Methanobrevibacter olleyae]AMK16186.1 thiamine monphosphate kinase ThiL [Methanobrevibacter olleyae]SFL52812.1 thiamine-monophosphate kinase [Methanobrevibacter olleyae]